MNPTVICVIWPWFITITLPSLLSIIITGRVIISMCPCMTWTGYRGMGGGYEEKSVCVLSGGHVGVGKVWGTVIYPAGYGGFMEDVIVI